MDPLEFNWTESQQVTVTNPTDKDYSWKVHGKEYTLAAGRSAGMPGFIAWLYVYGQAHEAAIAAGLTNRWNEIEVRQEYYEKFVAGVQPLIQDIQIEEPSLVRPLDDDADTAAPLPPGGANYEKKDDKKAKASAGAPAA